MALSLFDEDIEQATYYGIQSNGMDEAKFVFNLNKQFSFHFKRCADLDITIKNKVFCFSLYEFNDESLFTEYFLIRNLSFPVISQSAEGQLFREFAETEFIFNKYKEYDYIIKILGNEDELLLNDVSLRQSDFIQNLSLLSALTAKEKNLLIL